MRQGMFVTGMLCHHLVHDKCDLPTWRINVLKLSIYAQLPSLLMTANMQDVMMCSNDAQ